MRFKRLKWSKPAADDGYQHSWTHFGRGDAFAAMIYRKHSHGWHAAIVLRLHCRIEPQRGPEEGYSSAKLAKRWVRVTAETLGLLERSTSSSSTPDASSPASC